MSPSIILQFSQQFGHYLPRLVAGSSGGPHIITSTLEAILNVLVFGLNGKRERDEEEKLIIFMMIVVWG